MFNNPGHYHRFKDQSSKSKEISCTIKPKVEAMQNNYSIFCWPVTIILIDLICFINVASSLKEWLVGPENENYRYANPKYSQIDMKEKTFG